MDLYKLYKMLQNTKNKFLETLVHKIFHKETFKYK